MSEIDATNPAGNESQEDAPKPSEQPPKVYDEAYVKELRQEAAAARVAKKDAVEAAEKALTEAHTAALAAKDVAYTELQNELSGTKLELEKIRIALEAKVPSDKVLQFAEIMQGTDAETLTASAQKNLDLFGGFDSKSPPFDPSQGRGGKPPIGLAGDPILQAIKNAVGVR